jgi:hypothetical protein
MCLLPAIKNARVMKTNNSSSKALKGTYSDEEVKRRKEF